MVNKKRKRDSSPEPRFVVSSSSLGKTGPLLGNFFYLYQTYFLNHTLVSYPAVTPPKSTHFKCYARKKLKTDADDGKDDQQNLLVVGETKAVEFVTNDEETQKAAESGCRYFIAVHNKRTGATTLVPSSKTPHILSHAVKALKSLPTSAAPSKLQYLAAKNALGETFGTKKQKANIRAQERNRIDVGAMEGVMDYVMESIDKGAENLLTAEETKEAADNNRLIPPFSTEATDPADVYPLHSIIPEAEWKALSITPFDAAADMKQKKAMLPYQRSNWVNEHLKTLDTSTSKNKKNLKMLLYISAMLTLRQAGFKPIDKEKLCERLSSLPSITVESLLNRFAEQPRGQTSYQITSTSGTSLLTHIFALCLKVDGFATNTKVIAHDLSMSVTQVNDLFKSLGCKIIKLSDRERAQLGLADTAAEDKRAVLTAPVEFPKPRLRKKNK
ncbi:Rpa49 subunit specific to nuclear RNA polymerase I [Panaeolus papilionaceus]|nr:Rpa49 subunit specific to nuclear RNA polymerase I [Panaeolus papilionaceus]